MIPVKNRRPKDTKHVISLFRPHGVPIQPIDDHARGIAQSWGAEIVGVQQRTTGEEMVRMYWAR